MREETFGELHMDHITEPQMLDGELSLNSVARRF